MFNSIGEKRFSILSDQHLIIIIVSIFFVFKWFVIFIVVSILIYVFLFQIRVVSALLCLRTA